MLDVDMKLVKDDPSDEFWWVPYTEYLLNQVLPKDMKIQAKIQRET